jgi:hypothetical protein
MTAWSVRRRCRKIIRTLDIPVPFDVRVFCDRLAAARRRPIELRAMPMPPDSPSGLWVSTADRDYILHERDTTALHQEHIVMHELGHLLSDHAAATGLLLPHLDPKLVGRVLHRTTYSLDDERMAETIASMILEQAHRWKPVSEWEAPRESAAIRHRVARTIEPPR